MKQGVENHRCAITWKVCGQIKHIGMDYPVFALLNTACFVIFRQMCQIFNA